MKNRKSQRIFCVFAALLLLSGCRFLPKIPLPGKPAAELPKQLSPVRMEPSERTALYYCRRQLDAVEREAYDRISQAIREHSETVTTQGVSHERLFEIYRLVCLDHPGFFWNGEELNAIYTPDDPQQLVTLQLDYSMSAQEAEEKQEALAARTSPILRELTGKSDYEKVKGVYEYVISQTAYDEACGDQTLLSVLLEGRGLCAGYARAVQYLLQQLGVETLYISGTAEGASHSWNIVRLEDGYYAVDATWGDPVTEDGTQTLLYAYLCVTTKELSRTHSADETLISAPICTSVKYNYYCREGRLYERYEPEKLYAALISCREAGEPLDFKFSNEEAYTQAKSALFEGGELEKMLSKYRTEYGENFTSISYGTTDSLYCIVVRTPS